MRKHFKKEEESEKDWKTRREERKREINWERLKKMEGLSQNRDWEILKIKEEKSRKKAIKEKKMSEKEKYWK